MVSEKRKNEYFEELDKIEDQMPDRPHLTESEEKWLDRKFEELDEKYPDVIEWLNNQAGKQIRKIEQV